MINKVRLDDKFQLFNEYWSPKIVGEVNDTRVILAKLKGEFVWHKHDDEDELFLIIKGRLQIKLRDQDIWLDEGEFFIVPKGVEHLPVAEEEVHALVVQPTTTKHTGNLITDRTLSTFERI